jgi:dienelactone hydrolase
MLYAMVPWFYRHRQAVTIPILKSFFQTLKKEEPNTKIGVAGFCWGGRYAMLVGQTGFADQQLVDAVFAGHPSLVSIPTDVEHPYCPVSIAVASEDSVFSPKMADQVEKLWAKTENIKSQFTVYDGAIHGFCIRGNMNDEKEKKHMVESIEQVGLSLL